MCKEHPQCSALVRATYHGRCRPRSYLIALLVRAAGRIPTCRHVPHRTTLHICMYVTRRAAGAVVLNMGVLRADRNFVAPTRLHSVGFKGQWTYRPVASSPEAAAAGSPKSLPVFECEVAADGSLPQYSVYMKVRDDQ